MKRRRNGLSRALVAAAAVAVALGVGLVTLSPAMAAPDSVSIDSITVDPGAQGTVNLEALDIGSPGLGAWEIDIVYNPSVVTPVTCSPQNGSVCNPNFSSNTVRVVGASAYGLMGDSTLASITFRCTREGTSTLSLNVAEFADATENEPVPIGPGVQDGTVSCIQTTPPAPGAPTATPAPGEEPEPTATEPVVRALPKSGMGGGSDGNALAWLIGASVSAVVAASAGVAAWRLSARRT